MKRDASTRSPTSGNPYVGAAGESTDVSVRLMTASHVQVIHTPSSLTSRVQLPAPAMLRKERGQAVEEMAQVIGPLHCERLPNYL